MLLGAIVALISCDKQETYKDTTYDDRYVMIYYGAAYNSLSSDIYADVQELIAYTDFHTNDEQADAVLVYLHTYKDNGIPLLLYPHREKTTGTVVIDTLVTYSSNTISASATTLNSVLSYAQENFPASKYGLVISSHGTGYLPTGYYGNSSSYEGSSNSYNYAIKRAQRLPGGWCEPEMVQEGEILEGPRVKSIAEDKISSSSIYQMNIEDFAAAIPMKLDYIVFDACFMSGIEVAYQLKDKADWIVASPTEILADGMDYTTMADYLMQHPQANLEGLCENYYQHYNALSGEYQSATITLIDCSGLDALARVCAKIFANHSEDLDDIDYANVQQYFRNSNHWFYDLKDIIEHINCDENELTVFDAALDACIPYKAATETFMPSYGGFSITNYSGLSMMIPANAGSYL